MNGLEEVLIHIKEFEINGVNVFSMLTDPVVSTSVILSCLFFLMVIIFRSDKKRTEKNYNRRVRNIKSNYHEGFEREKEKLEKETTTIKEECEKTVQDKEDYITMVKRMFFSYRLLAPYRSVLEKHPRFIGFDMWGRAVLIKKPEPNTGFDELLSKEEAYYEEYGSFLPSNNLDKIHDIASNIRDTFMAFYYPLSIDGGVSDNFWSAFATDENIKEIYTSAFNETYSSCEAYMYLDNVLDYNARLKNWFETPYGKILEAPIREEFKDDEVVKEKIILIKTELRRVRDMYNYRPPVDRFRVDDKKDDDYWEPVKPVSYEQPFYDDDPDPIGIHAMWEQEREWAEIKALNKQKAIEAAWARGEDWQSLL